MLPSINSVTLFSTTVSQLEILESHQTIDKLTNQLQDLCINTTPDYQALHSTLLTMNKIAPLIQKLGLQKLLPSKDLFQICSFAQRIRQCEPFNPTYLKKDNTELCYSLIIDKAATYILLKGDLLQGTLYPQRKQGGEKRATWALQLPTDTNIPALRVCQLTGRDELTQELRDALVKEFTSQAEIAKEGICPVVLGIFEYSKTKKNSKPLCKTVAFVEAFDDDLRAFDPGQTSPADGSDPKPFTLTPQQICVIGEKVAQYISILHAKNMSHGDLGLENIGLCFNRLTQEITKIFLTDFGSSFTFQAGKKIHDLGCIYGHIPLTAPEFFRNDKVFNYPACDVYALGMLLSMLIVDVTKDIDTVSEPIWLEELVTIQQEAAENGVQPAFFKPNGTPTDEITQVLTLQEAYKTYSEISKLAIQNAADAESFLKALVGIMLHPDPNQRPTAAQVVTYFKGFKQQSNPPILYS